ncbi:MmgE/PrpD family protein [Pseudomonas benzenivorans]|uniref:MmgE/PrpD family protein n=1 Tax=Pseudomonas benzenivorans TaxID=556533 RepID=A0ABZ0PZD9_9PSED|nr:MmgE/PrpD family protein [Pseudomonas benzenivorans]WPC06235.1 MmgE/PrpD family protein [Pseudomonas benzenivorans]
MNAITQLLDHVSETRYEDLPAAAVAAAKVFILDSIGVGISGSRHPCNSMVKQVAMAWGGAPDARVLGTGERLPVPSAVMLNAYQIHNQEFDCVHDRAVVHTLASILPALLAEAERRGGASGKELILALVLGVDVAAFIGMAQGAPMRFFRPAMCGALGATAALSKLAGFDRTMLHNALGVMYSHLSGTMQAHIEGTPTVALQVGLNARAAVTAFDLARAGFIGPKDILEGPYGYFVLFDGQADWSRVSADLGQDYQIARMSHKPFPTGRACHGGIDGVLTLLAEQRFEAVDVVRVRILVPPLVVRLVGRPAIQGMNVGYAKLCMGYSIAAALLTGQVGIEDFDPEQLNDPTRLALAQRVEVLDNGIGDENALGPQTVEVELQDGRTLRIEVPAMLGHPQRPLVRSRQVAKFDACLRSAPVPIEQDQRDALLAALDDLENLSDVRRIVDLATSPA